MLKELYNYSRTSLAFNNQIMHIKSPYDFKSNEENNAYVSFDAID